MPRKSTARTDVSDSRGSRAFTLVELLVTIAILSVLVGVLLPLIGRAVGQARAFRCQMSLRTVAFDFGLFADDQLGPDRGADTRERPGWFRVETFQESIYGLHEFWRWEGENTHRLPDAQGNDPLRCAAVRGELALVRNTPCSQGAISPSRFVSYTFNLRLHAPAVALPSGGFETRPGVWLKGDLLEGNGQVPLAWDVDGAAAEGEGLSPVFSAPTAAPFEYPDPRPWFPALRHNGSLNVAFLGGHVLSSRRPLEESGWRWDFQPVK